MQDLITHMANNSNKTKISSQAIGRRKEAVASVRLVPGTGNIVVNGQEAKSYFPGLSAQAKYEKPFSLVEVEKFDVSAKVMGGGKNGQLDALVLGISRALVEVKQAHKTILRGAGLLTRDSRKRQRRMVGTGGKSRRAKQSPKR